MNILTDNLPETVNVDNIEYAINPDFKTWLKFYEIISMRDVNASKITDILILVYKNKMPPTLEMALTAALGFFTAGEESKKIKSSGKPVVDFVQDSGSIYAAFRQQYNINLTTEYLHWYEFKALLDGLTDETKLVKIMEYRSINLAKIKDKELKKHYREMKQLYRLKDNRTDEEREQELAEALFG